MSRRLPSSLAVSGTFVAVFVVGLPAAPALAEPAAPALAAQGRVHTLPWQVPVAAPFLMSPTLDDNSGRAFH